MDREFFEEAGVLGLFWRQFGVIRGNNYEVYLFTAKSLEANIESKTDELVGWYLVENLPRNIIPNLAWMIPMANYKNAIMADIFHPEPEC
jgi:hypothetical protein